MASLKTGLLLLMFGVVVNSRPEVGTSNEGLREGKAHSTSDSINLPSDGEKGDENSLKITQSLLNGGLIPVHLVYDHSQETSAIVKEVSENDFESSQEKRNRVTRSEKDSQVESTKRSPKQDRLKNTQRTRSQRNLNKEMDAFENFRDDADILNKALGIEARQRNIDANQFDGFENMRNVYPIRRVVQHYQILRPFENGYLPKYSAPSPVWLPDRRLFPIFFNNPYNPMLSSFTNIIEYRHAGEERRRRKRDAGSSSVGDHSGPQITRLKVRKGGVAIAGPGGIASAGTGGTAIVGPGGTAYTTTDGIAVVGPGGRVIEVPKMSTVVHARQATEPLEGRVVATGPVVYFNRKSSRVEARLGGEEVKALPYYGGALGRYLVIQPSGMMKIVGHNRPPPGVRAEDDEEDVGTADEGPASIDDTVTINQPPENASIAEAKPIAVSIAGVGGVASAQPVGTAIVGPGGLAVSRPVATAISGIKGAENLIGLIGGKEENPQPHYTYRIFHPTVFYYPLPLF